MGRLYIGGGSGDIDTGAGGGTPTPPPPPQPSTALSVLTYQPDGTAVAPAQFTSWTALYAAFVKTTGPVTIAIDVTFAPSNIAHIDPGTWDFQGRATLTSSGLNAEGGAELAIPDGSVLKNLTEMTGSFQLDTNSSVVPPLQWDSKPFADFTISNFAAILQRGAAPVIRVPAGQTFYLTLDGNILINSFSGAGGALVDMSDNTSILALIALSGLFLFLTPAGNFISSPVGVTTCHVAYLYDASWPGNPTNSNYHGLYDPPTAIDNAAATTYTAATPGNWAGTPPTETNAAIDRLAAAFNAHFGPVPP